MSRITTARGAAVLAAVAVSALALSACSGSGGGGARERRRRRHLEARHRPRLRPGRARLRPRALRQRSAHVLRGHLRLAVRARRGRPGRPRPRDELRVQRRPDAADARPRHQRDLRRRLDPQRRARQGRTSTPAATPTCPRTAASPRAARTRSSTSPSSTTTPSTLTFAAAQARLRGEPRHAGRRDRRRRPARPTARASTRRPTGRGRSTVDADATVKGNSYLLVKKDDNPEAADYPFDSYEFRPILDPQARVNAAISGEVDLANITSDTQAQVESAGTGLVANGGTVQNLVAFDKDGRSRSAVGRPARLPGPLDGDRPRDLRHRGAPG